MVDGDVVGDGVVATIDLPADDAHEAVFDLFDVLLVATPAWNIRGLTVSCESFH